MTARKVKAAQKARGLRLTKRQKEAIDWAIDAMEYMDESEMDDLGYTESDLEEFKGTMHTGSKALLGDLEYRLTEQFQDMAQENMGLYEHDTGTGIPAMNAWNKIARFNRNTLDT